MTRLNLEEQDGRIASFLMTRIGLISKLSGPGYYYTIDCVSSSMGDFCLWTITDLVDAGG